MNGAKPVGHFQGIDSSVYLSKLRLDVEPPSLAYLKNLQKAHLLNIPYENLDFHYGKGSSFSIQAFYKKIIKNRRGGIGLELNGLFFHLLVALGFECHLISSDTKKDPTIEFEHMAILVHLDGSSYLVDAGLPDSFLEPKKLEKNTVFVDYNRYFKFDVDPDGRWLLYRSDDLLSFHFVYRFSGDPVSFIQFMPRWDWLKTSPDSPQKAEKYVFQLFKSGQVTLTSRDLTLIYKGQRETYPIHNEDEFLAKLKHHFGIASSSLFLIN